MLLGYHKRTIDQKGRVILPKEFREQFRTGLIVTMGFDNCLFIYPMDKWQRIVDRVEEMPGGSEATLKFTRVFFSNACHLMPDGQGRVLIPPHLRGMAGLAREVVIIGLSTRAEMWDPARWEAYKEKSVEQFEQSAADIGF